MLTIALIFLVIGQICDQMAWSMSRSGASSVRQKISMDYAIIGVAGGSAETISCRLLAEGNKVTTILDRPPSSPLLSKSEGVYVAEDIDQDIMPLVAGAGSPVSLQNALSNKVVIAVGDPGDDYLRGNDDGDDGFGRFTKKAPSPALPILSKLAKSIPDDVQSVILSMSVMEDENAMKGGLGPFGGGASSKLFREWCQGRNKPFSLFRYGKLSGGVTGKEPIPFMGLPTLEPELHPSYALKSCVLTRPFKSLFTATDEDICTRDTLAEAIVQSIDRKKPVEVQVLSTEGSVLSKQEWEKSFQRLATDGAAELLRLDFASIDKFRQFSTWISSTWFPSALIDANAATILSGARPVRAVEVREGVIHLEWEDVQPDLTVNKAGYLVVTITEEPACLVVTRSQSGSLPGEVELMDNLVENIQKIYQKRLASALT